MSRGQTHAIACTIAACRAGLTAARIRGKSSSCERRTRSENFSQGSTCGATRSSYYTMLCYTMLYYLRGDEVEAAAEAEGSGRLGSGRGWQRTGGVGLGSHRR